MADQLSTAGDLWAVLGYFQRPMQFLFLPKRGLIVHPPPVPLNPCRVHFDQQGAFACYASVNASYKMARALTFTGALPSKEAGPLEGGGGSRLGIPLSRDAADSVLSLRWLPDLILLGHPLSVEDDWRAASSKSVRS